MNLFKQMWQKTSVHGVEGSNPPGGEILPEPKWRFTAQSLSCSPFHRLEMTEILLKGCKTLSHPSIYRIISLAFIFERQDQYFQNVWPDNNLLMLGLIFEYVKLYLWCQILAIFDVNQIWLTTWLFVYVPESDHKTDPSEKNLVLWADMSD